MCDETLVSARSWEPAEAKPSSNDDDDDKPFRGLLSSWQLIIVIAEGGVAFWVWVEEM